MPAKLPINLPGLPRRRIFGGARIGRATGIPRILKVMATNGSPLPVFESDDERTSFVIRLPVHAVSQPR